MQLIDFVATIIKLLYYNINGSMNHVKLRRLVAAHVSGCSYLKAITTLEETPGAII